MRILSVMSLAVLAVCVSSELCPYYEDIAPCDCEKFYDTGRIRISCYHSDITLKDLKRSFKSLVGKNDVEIHWEGLTLDTISSDLFNGIGVKSLHITRCEVDGLTQDENTPALIGLNDTLEELDITNSINVVDVLIKRDLRHLQKLRTLDFALNSIKELSNDWFENAPPSLEYLDLSYNEIEKLGDKVFANLNTLKELRINDNAFGNIQRSMLPSPAPHMSLLTLENNQLTDIPEDLFSNMPSLVTLSLALNKISRLEFNTFKDIWEQLEIINLEENPLECDSHMDWMFNLSPPSEVLGTCDGRSLSEFILNKGK